MVFQFVAGFFQDFQTAFTAPSDEDVVVVALAAPDVGKHYPSMINAACSKDSKDELDLSLDELLADNYVPDTPINDPSTTIVKDEWDLLLDELLADEYVPDTPINNPSTTMVKYYSKLGVVALSSMKLSDAIIGTLAVKPVMKLTDAIIASIAEKPAMKLMDTILANSPKFRVVPEYGLLIERGSPFHSCTLLVKKSHYKFNWYHESGHFGLFDYSVRFEKSESGSFNLIVSPTSPTSGINHSFKLHGQEVLSDEGAPGKSFLFRSEPLSSFGKKSIEFILKVWQVQSPNVQHHDFPAPMHQEHVKLLPCNHGSDDAGMEVADAFNDPNDGFDGGVALPDVIDLTDEFSLSSHSIQSVIDLAQDEDSDLMEDDYTIRTDDEDSIFTEVDEEEPPMTPNLRRSTRNRMPTNRFDAIFQADVEIVDDLIHKRIGMVYEAEQNGVVRLLLFFGSVMEFDQAEGKYVVEFIDQGRVLFGADELRDLVAEYDDMGWESSDVW